MNDSQTPARKKAYQRADELGFTREERLALAEYVLKHDVTSWKQLSDTQIERILDSMEGFVLVTALLMQRQPSVSSTA